MKGGGWDERERATIKRDEVKREVKIGHGGTGKDRMAKGWNLYIILMGSIADDIYVKWHDS